MSVGALIAVLQVLLVWTLESVAFIGLGSLCLRAVGRVNRLTNVLLAGLCVAIGFLQIWSLFFPVNVAGSSLVLVAGLIGLIVCRASVSEHLRTIQNLARSEKVLVCVLLLFCAWRATTLCTHFDTGLYGATSVEWINTFRTMPGLGNLHGRLGFNASTFLLMAAVNVGPLHGIGHHFFNSLVIAIFAIHPLLALRRVLTRQDESASDWFEAIISILALFWVFRADPAGESTDLAPAVLILSALQLLLSRKSVAPTDSNDSEPVAPTALVTLFAATAVTMKLSMLVFAGGLWIYCVALVCQLRLKAVRLPILQFIAFTTLALAIPYLARSVILTGYPLYPSSAFAMPVAWRMPVDAVKQEAAVVTTWARKAGDYRHPLPASRWFPAWARTIKGDREGYVSPIVLGLAGWILIFWLLSRGKRVHLPFAIFCIVFIALIFWFIGAPDPRFAEATIWSMAALPLAYSLCIIRARWTFAIVGGCLLVWCIAPKNLLHLRFRPTDNAQGLSKMPSVPLKPSTTDSGLVIFTPATDYQCWNSRLLCSPYPNPTLRLLDPRNFSDGFASTHGAAFPHISDNMQIVKP